MLDNSPAPRAIKKSEPKAQFFIFYLIDNKTLCENFW